jgi:hypothetical protein
MVPYLRALERGRRPDGVDPVRQARRAPRQDVEGHRGNREVLRALDPDEQVPFGRVRGCGELRDVVAERREGFDQFYDDLRRGGTTLSCCDTSAAAVTGGATRTFATTKFPLKLGGRESRNLVVLSHQLQPLVDPQVGQAKHEPARCMMSPQM